MAHPQFKNPNTLGVYSLATIFAGTVWMDWGKGYAEQWEVVLPKPTLGDIAEHAADLLTPEQVEAAKSDPYRAASDDLAEEFQQSDGRDSWVSGFDPMMSDAWKVELGYEVEPQAAADLMAIFAPSATLVEVSHDADGERLDEVGYLIALNGGGMYLGDHLIAAYLCCGAVPPVDLLRSMAQAGKSYVFARIPEALADAVARVQEHLAACVEQIGEQLERVTADNG